jgi:H+/Cl- antiporter ClcA
MGIIEHIFHEGETAWYSFLLKMVFTALTLGAGFKGGEIVPSFCIGAAFGCTAAVLLGLPVSLVAACGMVGVFCGVTNCPLTSLLISFELFGLEGMPYYLITIAVSYMLSGYYGLYNAQRIMYSKTETHYINLKAH